MKKMNITESNWKYLILLDACRYDYFEKVYKDFLEGSLIKIQTIGTSTAEWRDKNFPDYYDDIVYITANPNISESKPVYGYLAKEHFHNIIELWRHDWDIYRGTVLPETVTRRALEIVPNFPDKRFIIHYMQPHEPYLMPSINSYGYDRGEIGNERQLIGSEKYLRFINLKKRVLKNLLRIFRNTTFLGNQPEWIFRQLLHMPPRCAMDTIRRNYGKKVLRQAYEENLKYALRQVQKLVKDLDGKTIITSDHGELLGENRNYAHPSNSGNPILREVPWFEVCQNKQIEKNIDNTNEVKQRLKSLGYFD